DQIIQNKKEGCGSISEEVPDAIEETWKAILEMFQMIDMSCCNISKMVELSMPFPGTSAAVERILSNCGERFISETAECVTVKAYQQRIPRNTAMIRLPILILSLLAVSSVIAFKGYDDDFLDFNLKADTCIGQAGDQKLCDKYIGCDRKAPKRINDAFKKCVRENVSGGTIGKCNGKETLFKTPEEFDNYKKCLLDVIPM
ncbi:uncharacterized protein TNIN_249031, partial [Trichonephila inaurata madagascariensis]